MSGRGYDQAESFFINIDTREVRPAYPKNCVIDPDAQTYGEAEPPEHFQFHGLDVGVDASGRVMYYQVNHRLESGPNAGRGRESIEVFVIDLDDSGVPSLRWIGGILTPSYIWGNEVCVLPDGVGLTNFCNGGHDGFDVVSTGDICGQVLEWHRRSDGWQIVEGTDVNALNGIAVSPDGRYYFVASWATGHLHRISREDPHGDRASVDLGALLDNITWTPEGTLLAAGQAANAKVLMDDFAAGVAEMVAPIWAIEVDPDTLETRVLVRANPGDRLATTILKVDETHLWSGSSASSEILVYEVTAR